MGDREVVELTVERGAGNELANAAVLALSVVRLGVVAGTRPASRYAGERVVVLTDGDRTLRVPDRVLDASPEVRAVVGQLRPPGVPDLR